jgi:hypothetical protein
MPPLTDSGVHLYPRSGSDQRVREKRTVGVGSPEDVPVGAVHRKRTADNKQVEKIVEREVVIGKLRPSVNVHLRVCQCERVREVK